MTSERTRPEKMYKRFLFNKSYKVNDILNNLKTLTLHSKNYSDYVDNYYLNTQEICYKEPDQEVYPILKNKDYISLQKQSNVFDYHDKKKKFIKDNLISPNLKKNDDNSEKKKRNLTLTTFEGNKTYNLFFKNIKLPKLRNKLDNTSEFILCDLLFKEEYYNDLVYREELIFHRKKYYINLLKQRLKQLKSSKENRLNITTDLQHKFYTEKFGRIELNLSSIKIEVKNVTNPKNRIYNFDIPFDYVPLFFMGTFQDIKQLLLEFLKYNTSIGEYNKKNYISFNTDYLSQKIFNQIDDEGNIISFINNLKIDQDSNIKNDIPKMFEISNEQMIKYLKGEEEIKKCYNYNIINDEYYKKNENRNSIIFKSSVKKFEFFWVNQIGKYSIKITMPNILLRFIHMRKFVNQFIDKELLIYLLDKNFVNWDYYVLHYLFSIKYFRFFIQNILSKNKSESKNKSITETFFGNFELKKIGDQEFFSMKNQYNTSLNNSMTDIEYSFIITDRNTNKNYLFKIFSYIIYVYYEKYFGDENIYKFQLNFNQMKVMFLRNKKENLENFILKLLYIDSRARKMYLDYSYFLIFNDFSIKEIEEYFDQMDLKYNENFNNKERLNLIHIFITKPHFEIIELKENENNDETILWNYCRKEISDELLSQLIENDINDWPDIIYNNNINYHQIFIDYNHLHEFKTSKTFSPIAKKSTVKSKKSVFADRLSALNLGVLKKK